MTDIWDHTVAYMKLGVPFPIPNSSFRYWSDPGTWASLEAWTKNGAGMTIGRSWEGYDDKAGVVLSGSSVPADETHNIASTIKRFWNDNDNTTRPTSLDIYTSAAIWVVAYSGGTTPQFKIVLETDATSAFSSAATYNLVVKNITGTDSAYVLNQSTVNKTVAATEKWARIKLVLRDATSMVVNVDCVGIMFNPFGSNGYTTLTGVLSTTGPEHRERTFNQDTVGRLGNTRRYDPSGGARKLILPLSLEHETLATWETIHKYWSLNHGTPGLPGVPLMVEPNLPGFPPTIMVNIKEVDSPLTRQGTTADNYGGSITFESVYAY